MVFTMHKATDTQQVLCQNTVFIILILETDSAKSLTTSLSQWGRSEFSAMLGKPQFYQY